ncbi:uncharacterized protein LOC124838934, partial [Vigna umbellata]|uniref:uncharacterized protein LOC124838934 n=1 Tax=Vigna umbellata TaxID=87088 RepID=UPI001F5FF145
MATRLGKGIWELIGLIETSSCPRAKFHPVARTMHSKAKKIMIDTLAMVEKLEEKGVSSKEAKAITMVITECLNDTVEIMSLSTEKILQDHLSKFRAEMQNSL